MFSHLRKRTRVLYHSRGDSTGHGRILPFFQEAQMVPHRTTFSKTGSV